MPTDFENNAKILKALADASRLKIIDILSCGERCACQLLDEFNFTQPTLSHHMKVLSAAHLVSSRKEGLWNYYTLNKENYSKLIYLLNDIQEASDYCICNSVYKKKCK